MAQAARYFYDAPQAASAEIAAQVTPQNRAALEAVAAGLEAVAWSRDAIGALLKSVAAEHKLKPGQVMMPLRWLVTGTPNTPAIDAVLALLGRDEVLARIARQLP